MSESQELDSGDELAALLEAELAGTEEGNESPARDGPAAKKPRLASAAVASSCPPHPGFMGGICIRCGALKDEADEVGVALSYIHRGLEVSRHEAERMRQGTADRLLAHRKLLLILDLDHTLLNSNRFQDIPPQFEHVLRAQVEAQQADAPMLYRLPHMKMWTKLRPGVRQFLEQAKESFELAVYTMGDRDYAREMALLLDPGGRLFGGRVISSGDSTQRHVKDLDVVLGRERAVLVLDDTEGVWPRHRDNLVQIERYLYFPADAARFGYRGRSLLERAVDESAEGGALATCLGVMEQVQQQFFAQGDASAADVRPLLQAARRRILAGVRVLFSRVVPRDCADPTVHPLWQLAVKLGAECLRNADDWVTHVVATNITDKTRWAEGQAMHVVSPSWLWCCAYTWTRAKEGEFPVAARGAAAQLAPPKSEAEDLAAAMAAAGGGTAPTSQQPADGADVDGAGAAAAVDGAAEPEAVDCSTAQQPPVETS